MTSAVVSRGIPSQPRVVLQFWLAAVEVYSTHLSSILAWQARKENPDLYPSLLSFPGKTIQKSGTKVVLN